MIYINNWRKFKMFKNGKTFVTTNINYPVSGNSFHSENPLGIDISDIEVDVEDFEIYFKSDRNSHMVDVWVRPLGGYQDWEFHPIQFRMTYEEASEAYGNLNSFIAKLYANDTSVFDQNPLEMEVYTHNRKLIEETNDDVFMDDRYENNKLAITPEGELRIIEPYNGFPYPHF